VIGSEWTWNHKFMMKLMILIHIFVSNTVEYVEERGLHRHEEIQLNQHLCYGWNSRRETHFCQETVDDEEDGSYDKNY
jgi:hypothetical protein